MNKKLFSILLLVLFIFSSSCKKKQVAQTLVENPNNQVQENKEEKANLPEIETDPETVEDETKPTENFIPTYSYGVWETTNTTDSVYDYPINKSLWVKDPYIELMNYKLRCRVGRSYLDINQDDVPELFLSWYGGTGGKKYVVYQITKDDYLFLGNLDFFPSPQILPTKHNGFKDLMLFWRSGGNAKGETEGILRLFEFNGKKYNVIKEMNIIMEEAIQKKIFAPNTDKLFSHHYISYDDKEPNKIWAREADDKYRRMIK